MKMSKLTGLFGSNSSGKTSVLQLLLMLKQTVESTDRATVLDFGDERSLTNLGSFDDIVFGHKKGESVHVSLAWTCPKKISIFDPMKKGKVLLFSGENMHFWTHLRNDASSESNKLAVSDFSYALEDNSFKMERKAKSPFEYKLSSNAGAFKFKRTQGRAWSLPSPVKFYGFPDQVYAYYQNASFLAELQLEFEEMLKNLYYLGPLRNVPLRHYTWTGSDPSDMGRRGERVVDAILASRVKGPYISPGHKKKRITLERRVAQWLKDLKLIHSFRVEAIAEGSNLYQVLVQKSPNAAEVLITDVGFGVSQVMPVLVLCYYVPEGSTILLEQPEIHLHPSVQSGLADVFIDVMKNRGVQIILESHSEHLLRRIQLRMAEASIRPEDTSLYFCESKRDGSVMEELDIDLFGNISNWPKDFFGDEFGEMAAITTAHMKRKKMESA